ncbi:exocyst complex subunit Sec15-like-domain-containing protein [Polychytrium aggregatum]|uniref:exocyst complex subunit Sec15-like-domain-containing protein n=1 Tax=Polychytrium aggregatum TaxID=110093 RepID=UPI0022FDC922|nr:exocyst complex subunit Sec15-like-domain-containing protein [Polychytrium aggregatum]KAI9202810.1 exocyst complex subunit Sec15-like-domain-containing protein [Polychytrium aggregatum]
MSLVCTIGTRIREKTRLVGKLAIERTTAQQARLQRQRALMGTSSSKLDLLMTEDSTNTYEFDIDDVQLDFKPLYQCLHIHEVLERREEFKKSYEENRHHQAQLVLDTKLVFDEKLENFSTYLNDIVGFFIIEAMILNTTQNFRSRGNIEGLWKMAVEKINLVITESLHDCQNPKLFLNIKVMVGVFIRTIEGYGYAVNKLTDLIVSLFDRYAELMKLSCCETIIKIIEDDEYAPLVVQTPEELKDVNAAFKYTETSKIATTRFPRSLPFSKGFILCCSNIKEFIDVFYRFAESFSKQHTAMDDVIKKALDELLQRQLNSAILDQIMISNLSQVVQIIVNIGFICQACKEFEEMIEKNSNSKPGTVTLQATKTFQETINVAEKRIFELLNTKIDDFLELADYEWEAVESNDSPSPYLLELVNYLTSVITSTLSNLTPSLKSYLYFDSFGHLGRALNGLWLNPSVKIISLGFVRTFKIDVLFLKTFVKGLGDIEIGDAFVELDQTIEYLLSERYEDFLDAAVRSAKYNRIKVSNAVVLLEKLKGPDVGVFSKVSAHEAARKRHIAGVIKSINASQKSASPGKSMFG